jgi:enoyl-CoA hydratase
MTFENIIVETLKGGVGLVRLNRPKVLNALNTATLTELVAAFDGFTTNDDVRCVVLTGDARAFAAGADISEMAGQGVADVLSGNRFGVWQRLREFPKPVIAAVSGVALGGGLELAMTCDIVIASESARFGQPEINLGIIPGAGGTQRLTRAVGKSLAMEMILNARMLIARQIASRAPIAVRLAKNAVLKSFDTTLEVGLEAERHNFYLLFGTQDQKEGMAAFLEKRRANWTGK